MLDSAAPVSRCGHSLLARNPFNPQPLIYHLTNNRTCGIL
jgi:hypothetical protein